MQSFLSKGDLELRTVEKEDIEFLQKCLNSVKNGLPRNLVKVEKFFEETVCNDENIHLILRYRGEDKALLRLEEKNIEMGSGQIGFANPEGFEDSYNVKGLKMFSKYLFDNLRLHRLEACIFEGEEDKLDVFRKTGFTKEGVNLKEGFFDGNYQNAVYLGVLEGELER